MVDESKVLSTEEVDALSKASQDSGNDLTKLTSGNDKKIENPTSADSKALNNIMELTWSECERIFSSFVRKRIVIKSKSHQFSTVAEALNGKTEKHVYAVFQLKPDHYYGIVVMDLPLLHQMINLIYGGQINEKEPIMEAPGNVGVIVASKIADLALQGFAEGCREYGVINYEMVKTVILPNLISKLAMDDRVYAIEHEVIFGAVTTSLSIFVPEAFLQDFTTTHPTEIAHVEPSSSWRSAIETQVIDSHVTVTVSLPDISIKAKDLIALKNGDIIPISDPTQVDVCLNGVKLFRGSAAQANSNLVVKILGEI